MNRAKLGLSKTDLRILMSKLEILEKELIIGIKTISRNEHRVSRTRYANLERRIRLKLNALELLKLHLETINKKNDVSIRRQKKATGFRQTCSNVKRSIAEIKAQI